MVQIHVGIHFNSIITKNYPAYITEVSESLCKKISELYGRNVVFNHFLNLPMKNYLQYFGKMIQYVIFKGKKQKTEKTNKRKIHD